MTAAASFLSLEPLLGDAPRNVGERRPTIRETVPAPRSAVMRIVNPTMAGGRYNCFRIAFSALTQARPRHITHT